MYACTDRTSLKYEDRPPVYQWGGPCPFGDGNPTDGKNCLWERNKVPMDELLRLDQSPSKKEPHEKCFVGLCGRR